MRPTAGHWTGAELTRVKAELANAHIDIRDQARRLVMLSQQVSQTKQDCEKRLLHELMMARQQHEAIVKLYEDNEMRLVKEIERLKLLIGPMDAILTVNRRTCG